ncbi:MAG TPA: carboxymuconolactone decarboxylase family protein [Myxococcota bacterium]|nr:carboxymuconolactone decarboxylase family protein [Myxococcota bacterium]
MAESKAEKGAATLQKLFGTGVRGSSMAPAFAQMTVEHLFGDVWQRPGLTVEERSLLTCTVLIALGREAEQKIHFRGARNLGIPRAKLEEVLIHVAHYAGWPVSASGSRVLDEVWRAMDAEQAKPA